MRRAFALAAAAFLARAVRSSGVIVSRLRLPPILPPLEPPFFPSVLKYAEITGGTLFFGTSVA